MAHRGWHTGADPSPVGQCPLPQGHHVPKATTPPAQRERCCALSRAGGSLKSKMNEQEWGGGETARWDSQRGDSRPLSAALLPLLQQLDDLSDALLGDLRGTEGVSASGDTPGLAGVPGEGSRGSPRRDQS